METEWEMLTPAAAASSVSILLPVADVIASVWLSHTHTHTNCDTNVFAYGPFVTTFMLVCYKISWLNAPIGVWCG